MRSRTPHRCVASARRHPVLPSSTYLRPPPSLLALVQPQSSPRSSGVLVQARLARALDLFPASAVTAVLLSRHARPGCNWQAADPRGPESAPPSRFPLLKIGEVLALWAVYLALQLVKSRYNRCAAPYFGIFGCQVPRHIPYSFESEFEACEWALGCYI